MEYPVVSSIQMGANIDCAIVIASRYREEKRKSVRRTAMINTLDFAFPIALNSETILSVSGILIGMMASDVSAETGQSLGCRDSRRCRMVSRMVK